MPRKKMNVVDPKDCPINDLQKVTPSRVDFYVAIGLVTVALAGGVVMANADDFSAGYKAFQRGDYPTALRISQQFADQGDADTQILLALMYGKGLGVAQDYVQAHMWYNLAAAQGNKTASKNRNLLEKMMTPAQIAEAQRLAREWKPKRK